MVVVLTVYGSPGCALDRRTVEGESVPPVIASLLISAVLAATGCRAIDDVLGAEDHERISIVIVDEQPADSTHGVLVEVRAFATDSGALDIDVAYGQLRRGGGMPVESMCTVIRLDGGEPEGVTVPLAVLPSGDEALLVARLLDDLLGCNGDERIAELAFISAPAADGADPDGGLDPDAGPADADVTDAEALDASPIDGAM
jgi:hypothetical protein